MTRKEWKKIYVHSGDKVKITKKDSTVITGILGWETHIPKIDLNYLDVETEAGTEKVNLHEIETFEVIEVIPANHLKL